MARKTPEKVIAIIKMHADMRNAINTRQGKSQAEKVAALDAINVMMEGILNLHNCYAGYKHVGSNGGPIDEVYYRKHAGTGKMVLDPVVNASHDYFVRK